MRGSKKTWKIIGVVALAIVLFLAIKYHVDNNRKTSEMVALADQFQAPEGWTLTNETIHRAQFGCIETKCPSMIREWQIKEVASGHLEEALRSLEDTSWRLGEGVGCDVNMMADKDLSCLIRGETDGMNVYFNIRGSQTDNVVKALLKVN
jgi:hypothetical protein